MITLFRRLPRLARGLLIALAVVLIFSVLSLIALARDESKQRAKAENDTSLSKDSSRDAGEDTVRFRVPASRVPRSVEDAQSAAPITLTPSRWESDPENAVGGDVPTTLPEAERIKVGKAVGRFINAWERFPSFKMPTDFRSYQSKLARLTTPDSLSRIVRRDDNVQPPYICPEPRCVAGSEPFTYEGYSGPAENFEVRSYDPAEQSVYVVAYGLVRYTGEDHPLANRSYDRSYGLVLEQHDGKWLVARAAADTTGPSR